MNIYQKVLEFLTNDPCEDMSTTQILELLQKRKHFRDANEATIKRCIQRVRKSFREDTEENYPDVVSPPSENLDSDDCWYEYHKEKKSYTIKVSTARLEDIPENEVQCWVEWYTNLGGRLTQSQVKNQVYLQFGRTLTKNQMAEIFRVLEITKDSLPLAPHKKLQNENQVIQSLETAQMASIETRFRAREADNWRRRYESLYRKLKDIDFLAEKVTTTVDQDRTSLDVPTIDFDATLEPYEGVLLLTDWHVGECFHTPFNAFNKDVFEQRLQKLAQECFSWFKAYRRPLKRLHIAIGGDMIDGVLPMRDGHNLEQDLHEGEQVEVASKALAWLIESLQMFTGVETLVWSVGGNHDRAGGPRGNDPNRIIAQWLAQVTQARLPDHIKWKHTTETVLSWKVQNTLVLLSHGDTTPRDPKKLSNPYRRKDVDHYLVLTGHKHSPQFNEDMDTLWIQGGCMPGADSYAANRFGVGSRPTQVFIEVRKDGPRPAVVFPLA